MLVQKKGEEIYTVVFLLAKMVYVKGSMNKRTYRICCFVLMIILTSMVLGGCKILFPQEEEFIELTNPNSSDNKGNNKKDKNKGAQDDQDDIDESSMHMGTVEVIQEVIYVEDFEGETTEFTRRGDLNIEIVKNISNSGKNSLYISGRAEAWNGAKLDLTEVLLDEQKYIINAWVLYEEGPDTIQVNCKIERNGDDYLDVASNVVNKGEWTKLKGSAIIPENTDTAIIYFETDETEKEIIDFYIDKVIISHESVNADRGNIPSLKEVYNDLFTMGVAVAASDITGERKELIKQQFNSLTPANELKPENILDYEKCISDSKYDDSPAVKFDKIEPILEFAKEAEIPVRGHTLIWHDQTPRWFFTEGYSKDKDAPLVSKKLMLKRMKNYIKQVLEYTQTNYPGLIYCWDVVNEVVNPGDMEENGLRTKGSLWYKVIGPSYIEKAFEYAREYADPDVKLFLNDYDTEERGKARYIANLVSSLQEKGLIDGIGLQTHLGIEIPSLVDVDRSIKEYGKLGLEIHITELDMDLTEHTEEELFRQARRYKRLFSFLKTIQEEKAANITNITFWGLTDDSSWLNKPGKSSYPLLFDEYLLQKPAFWGVVLNPDIPLV